MAWSKTAKRLTCALAVAVTLAAAGCREHTRLDDVTAGALNDPDKRHPIAFTKRSEVLYVEVAKSGDGLSPNQEADVWRFLERYKSENAGPLRISAPNSARGHMAAARSMKDINELVANAGIPKAAVDTHHTRGASEYGSALKLAYDRPVALAPECGAWPEDLGHNRERVPYDDFGCATQHNLAMTVANARDLRIAQEETPRSSERRDVSWTKYVDAGKSPASQTGGAQNGAGQGSTGGPAIRP